MTRRLKKKNMPFGMSHPTAAMERANLFDRKFRRRE